MNSEKLVEKFPLIEKLGEKKPVLWVNPDYARPDYIGPDYTGPDCIKPDTNGTDAALSRLPLDFKDIQEARHRLEKFAPLLAELFPELESSSGIIESQVSRISAMGEFLFSPYARNFSDRLWIKSDHALPVAGSVKARGGIYEVLCFAESLALENNLITKDDPYEKLASEQVKQMFSRYTVAVGSTGNLGLSIGIMAASLGFKACVHMSVEAREWKKKRLRTHGVDVIEHPSDYSSAVAAGRKMSENDPFVYFVDDENSERLFLGYSVAGPRLKDQMDDRSIVIDADHPLFVYLPCGVGGAPGGIAFGLKSVFKDFVHCFFAEPAEAPCMMLAMMTGFEKNLSVYDIGLKIDTEADGLAVGTASELAGSYMKELVSGCFTVEDDDLFKFLYQLEKTERIRIEPSAAAGFAGPGYLLNTREGKAYIKGHGLTEKMNNAYHLVWTTGGLFVPPEEYEKFRDRGRGGF